MEGVTESGEQAEPVTVDVESASDPAHAGSTSPSPARSRLIDWIWRFRGSLLFLWLPTLGAALYYALAADLYASETKFVVRSPSKMAMSPLTSLMQGTGIAGGAEEAHSVNDFILSRDAIHALEQRVALRDMFNRPEADYFARYPNLFYDSTEEDFHKYWQKRVSVGRDSATGISTIVVRAFRAEDAHQIADLLLQESEGLVNRLNQRSRTNAITDAQIDVDLAAGRVLAAQQKVLQYRNREELLDPSKSSAAIMETLARLRSDLTAAQMRQAELERGSSESPLLTGLRARIDSLRRQIQDQQGRLAGGADSIAPKIPEYEQLTLQQELAAKELASATGSLESARTESRRQTLYLDRVVQPSLPDKAEFPKRIRSVLTVFCTFLLLYAIGRFLMAGVREHAQT